ncbi:aldolase A [Emiliania huxleyi CCMP1516]|uniref:fructose-bisphosphate aldolase n=2 Tax=Emiliania huxleyi TaxID=2903 RepID=A0A0D3K4Z7_EMIH1|nr:aldolase A [Emiliania huxleyi CCMP1516]EOD30832.1 aldolase A [Emiliania huxleyi CCMP1516]|eukprot:XP_005783261.1 aldolase A [Emiliania huxleyi CCMP1516]
MLTLSAAAALAYSPTVAAPHARTSAASVSSRASAPRLGLLQKLGLRRGARFADDLGLPCVDECAVASYPNLPPSVHPGVVTGQALVDLLQHAKENRYAIPAVNCVTSSSVNTCLEAARKADAPIIIQFSSGGSQFYAGKGLDNTDYKAAIAGAVSGAYHVRAMAEQYGVPVILHTDHCAKNLLPWLDGMLAASERYYAAHREPLFSSHMIDLSEEPLEENIDICVSYLQRMAKLDMLLEMELGSPRRRRATGITGGEEDGVDNEDANPEDLYSKPEEIWQVYEKLSAVPNGRFTVAAAFGNVHGVYAPGNAELDPPDTRNVKLDPEILGNAQTFIADKVSSSDAKPVSFVFHGGSGSDLKDIKQANPATAGHLGRSRPDPAIDYGVVKMNIDTDTQWSYWDGIRAYYKKYEPYLNSQIGNPDGADKPNKKFYDPRACLRSAEDSTNARLQQCFEDLNCVGILGLGDMPPPQNVLGPRRGALPC